MNNNNVNFFIILITGAERGLGKGIINSHLINQSKSERKYKIILTSYDEKLGNETVKEFNNSFGSIVLIPRFESFFLHPPVKKSTNKKVAENPKTFRHNMDSLIFILYEYSFFNYFIKKFRHYLSLIFLSNVFLF